MDGFNELLLAKHPNNQKALSAPATGDLTVNAKDKATAAAAEILPICPFTWSKAMHGINCEYAWPKEYTGNHGEPLIELDTDAYVGRLSKDKVVERVLAMGGIRLAHVLNFALGGEGGVYVDY